MAKLFPGRRGLNNDFGPFYAKLLRMIGSELDRL